MDSNTLLMSVQDKLPKDSFELQGFKERLDRLDEKARDEFMAKIPLLKLKSPLLVFWVGSFLFGNFGVGRFMIGDMVLGGARLAITLLALIFSAIAQEGGSSTASVIGGLCVLVMWIWWIADLFLVGKKLRKTNLNTLLLALPQ
ncbi:MAG: hypothetical protein J1E28_01005 [Helicobacter sp.]|uniref:hypothetical protein n=1 Tax=Helicobacter sp. TaxID=218 RepID=UPI0025C10CD1|nr:hypothetical protein [Helicobacter sp.]MCH5312968.1 hypothetical protein [Helicobacter sp.]